MSGAPSPIQIGHDELRAHAGSVVNQFGNEFRAAFRLGVPNSPVPIEDGRAVWVGIKVALEMREEPLSDDHVRHAVAIHVGEGGAVRLREGHAAGILRAEIAHDVVAHKRNVALRVALLLEPGEAPTVCSQGRDHIVQTVAIHVVNAHLRAAAAECAGWNFQRPSPAPVAGCSHHPRLFTMSMRPSPLMSPTPMPCGAARPGSEILWTFQAAVGLAGSGFAYAMSRPGRRRESPDLPSPSISRNTSISEVAFGTTL